MTDKPGLITVQDKDGVLVLTVALRRVASFESAEEMGQELACAVHGQEAPKVVVDLSNVEYMSSVGFGPFISLRVLVRGAGGRLVLCGLSALLKEMFETTRMLIHSRSPKALFEFADSLENAVALARS